MKYLLSFLFLILSILLTSCSLTKDGQTDLGINSKDSNGRIKESKQLEETPINLYAENSEGVANPYEANEQLNNQENVDTIYFRNG